MKHHPRVVLRKNLASSIRSGHPWLYQDAVEPPHDLGTGTVVDVVTRDGKFVARGLWDAHSPIAVRIWTTTETEKLDFELARRRVESALDLRRHLVGLGDTEALRLIHGEADRMPGIVCDYYAKTCVFKLDSAAVRWLLPAIVNQIVQSPFSVDHAVLRQSSRTDGEPAVLEPLLGNIPTDTIHITENGIMLEVDIARGHKTGLYLDQRDNRRRIQQLSAGMRVLNVFSYTGGFSVAAACGGADSVTSVDIGAPVIAAAKRNFRLNGLDPELDAYTFVTADVFQWLDKSRDPYDLVIVDPPSMAPSAASLKAAERAYRKLNALALLRVAPGGILFTASCSSHITETQLINIVGESAEDAKRQVRIVEFRGAAPDHPVLPSFPEGRYLTGLLLYVD
ncbi:MAG: class I SAM-dependent rRNA methyltransferase [Myxococcales bacterium]|nr:class I SAM-dependent rRNA methyltransferase [Myxococcales bacterium]